MSTVTLTSTSTSSTTLTCPPNCPTSSYDLRTILLIISAALVTVGAVFVNVCAGLVAGAADILIVALKLAGLF